MHADWLRPDWPAPAHVHAVCTTRAGGVSQGVYASLNLGDHVGDVAAAVAANRVRLAQAIRARPVFMQQVHGWQVAALSAAANTEQASAAPLVADACLGSDAGVACTIMVADCLPVLFTNRAGRAVAAAHAGWRGLAGDAAARGTGVLERTVAALRTAVGAGIADGEDDADGVLAWLGPCIGPQAFEVGDEVRAVFVAGDAAAAALFVPHSPGKWLADLPGLARQRLATLGVSAVYGNDGSTPWCTVANPSRFFSHRRDRVSGRFAACIWKA